MIFRLFSFLLLSVFALPVLAEGPSFDCSKAATTVELAICSSDLLSTQDNELLDAYLAARDSGKTSRDEQRTWIRERADHCGGNVECLFQMNQDRIDALTSPDESNPSPRTVVSNVSLAEQIQVEGQNYLGETIPLIACNSNSDLTNVRAGPSARQFDTVYQFLNGQTVSVIDRVTNEAGFDYFRVIYPLELGGGRLFDKVGFVYYEALDRECDVDFEAVLAANTEWPVSLAGTSCTFKVANRETLDYWSDITSIDVLVDQNSEDLLCDEAGGSDVIVKSYIGVIEEGEKHVFIVALNGCDVQFSLQEDTASNGLINSVKYSWRYDPVCLENLNSQNQRQVRNSPDIGVGDLFSFVFGAGVQGLAAISGTTSEELLSPTQDKDLFCYDIDDEDGQYACLGEPYLTDNRDARDILLGNCFGLTDQANDSGLREVCVGVTSQSCFSMDNSDHAFACTTCGGSRQWAAVYATGNILTCYP